MLMDKKLYFSDNQALASISSGSEDDSTYHIDMTGGNKSKDGWGTEIADFPGEGQNVIWNTVVTQVFVNSGSGSTLVSLYAHTGTSSYKSGVHLASVSFPTDSAVGTMRSVSVGISNLGSTYRYLGLGYKGVGATKLTTGKTDSWLSLDGQTQVEGSSN